MKLSLSRTSKPDPKVTYQVVAGFCADTPTMPNRAPRIGSTVRGDSPLIAHMFAIGASRYFLPADADSIEVGLAYDAATYGFSVTPTPDPSIQTPGPSLHPYVCIKPIMVGGSQVVVGSFADRDDPLVKRFPANFAPAPKDGYTE